MHHSEVNINDRMFVVSDEVLERLICSQCKKYLSVKKIKVYPNRGIKCGRCSNAEDAGVVSLFGVLAEQALFRCVNRFEGCNQLLSYYDVADHERTCVGKEYECPCCIEQFKGTGYEIYVHFKEQHADRLLVNTPEFILEIDNELAKSYLFRKNDLLFYVDARYSRGEEELILSITYFGTDQEALKISHMFTLHSLDAKVKHKTVRKECYSVTGGQLKHFKINLSPEDFPKNVVVCRFDLYTENVEKLIALPGNFNNNQQGLGDIDNTIKQSPFGQRRYPVTVYDPPVTRGFMWGNHTTFSDSYHQSGSILGQPNFGSAQTQNQKASSSTGNVDIGINTLVESFVNDLIVGEKGDQWLLSCYAPFKEKPAFPGFDDQSPEEIRFGFYEAQKNGTMEQYKTQLQTLLQDSMMKIKALQNPAQDVVAVLQNIYSTPPSSYSGTYGQNVITPSADSKPSPGYFFDPLKESKPTDSVFTDKFKPVFFGTAGSFGTHPIPHPNLPPNQNDNPFLLQPSIFKKDPNCPPTYQMPHQQNVIPSNPPFTNTLKPSILKTDLKSATSASSLYSNPQPATGSTTCTNSFGDLFTSRPSTRSTTTDSSPLRFTPSGFTFNSNSAGISRPQLKPSKSIFGTHKTAGK